MGGYKFIATEHGIHLYIFHTSINRCHKNEVEKVRSQKMLSDADTQLSKKVCQDCTL